MSHSRLLRSFGALLITIGLFAGFIQPALAVPWTFSKVQDLDFPNLVNLYPSVVASPSGDFYLAYKRSDLTVPVEELVILKWNGAQSHWDPLHRLTPSTPNINITQFIDYLALVVNSDNDIHLVFRGELAQTPFENSTRGIHYGHFDGQAWSFNDIEIITNPTTFEDANYPALAVDASGAAHMAYVKVIRGANSLPTYQLVYAVNTQGTWTKTVLKNYSTGFDYVLYPAITLDSQGPANIIYYHWHMNLFTLKKDAGNLNLATNASGDWSESILVSEATNETLTPYDIRADSAGKLHLTYSVSLSPSLVTSSFYGTNAGGSWEISPVPESTGNDGMPRISLNEDGVKILTYVSYIGGGVGDLKVATQSGSGSWRVETVDPARNISGVVTAAINDHNQLMIVEERLDSSTKMKQLWSATTSLPFTSVTSVDVPANGTYRAGDELGFTVHFNEDVTVTGTPSLPVMLDSGMVQAAYISGSGTSTLTFRYTVPTGEQDANGIALGAALALNGGTIQNGGGSNAHLVLAGVPSTAGILVDTLYKTYLPILGYQR